MVLPTTGTLADRSAFITDAYGQGRLYSFTTETLPTYNNARPQILTVDEQVPV